MCATLGVAKIRAVELDGAPVDDRISVLLVDDHALVRGGLRRLLGDDPGIEVVGEVSEGEAAVRAASRLAPTVVILDYVLPGDDGLVVLRRLREARPDAAVLMLSMRADEPLVREALAAGASGFIAKGAVEHSLADSVRRVARGEIVVSTDGAATSAPSPGRPLTPRQSEVLRLICRGCSMRAIAAELGLSEFTVRVHRAGIMRALGIHRTTALVVHALRHGLVDLAEASKPRDDQSSST